jgi:hypothetical protein
LKWFRRFLDSALQLAGLQPVALHVHTRQGRRDGVLVTMLCSVGIAVPSLPCR